LLKLFNLISLVFIGLDLYLPFYKQLFDECSLPRPVLIFIGLLILNALLTLIRKQWMLDEGSEDAQIEFTPGELTGIFLPFLFMIGFPLLAIQRNLTLFTMFLASYLLLAAAYPKIMDAGRDDYHGENTGGNTVITCFVVLTIVWAAVATPHAPRLSPEEKLIRGYNTSPSVRAKTAARQNDL